MDTSLQEIRLLQHSWHEEKVHLQQRHEHQLATLDANSHLLRQQTSEWLDCQYEERRVLMEMIQKVVTEKLRLSEQVRQLQQVIERTSAIASTSTAQSHTPSATSPPNSATAPSLDHALELQSLRQQLSLSSQTIQMLTSTINAIQREKEELTNECSQLRDENRRLRQERMQLQPNNSSLVTTLSPTHHRSHPYGHPHTQDSFHPSAFVQYTSAAAPYAASSATSLSSHGTGDHTPLPLTSSSSPLSLTRQHRSKEATESNTLDHEVRSDSMEDLFAPSTPRSFVKPQTRAVGLTRANADESTIVPPASSLSTTSSAPLSTNARVNIDDGQSPISPISPSPSPPIVPTAPSTTISPTIRPTPLPISSIATASSLLADDDSPTSPLKPSFHEEGDIVAPELEPTPPTMTTTKLESMPIILESVSPSVQEPSPTPATLDTISSTNTQSLSSSSPPLTTPLDPSEVSTAANSIESDLPSLPASQSITVGSQHDSSDSDPAIRREANIDVNQ